MTLTNWDDQHLPADDHPPEGAIRTVTVHEVMVDTGSSHLFLPIELIERLGLEPSAEVDVRSAAGIRRARRFEGVEMDVEGRRSTFSCVDLPPGSLPLLGMVPLGALGLEPDLANHRLRLLPNTGPDTYLSV